MENNNSITFDSIKQQKEMPTDVDETLELQHRCCIYKVPKRIRETQEEAYTPKVISIGPFHHGKEELAAMEKQKIRYLREFNKRISSDTWENLISFIEKHETHIRHCYEERCKLQKLEYVTMILYDAVFIIELFLKYSHDPITDFLLIKPQIKYAIRMDLLLLENQLPFFVLDGLYMLAFPYPNPDGEIQPSFFQLSCKYFKDSMFNGIAEEFSVKHLLDLERSHLTKAYPTSRSKGSIAGLPCALKLHESGVKFKRIDGESLLEIKCEKRKRIQCLKLQAPYIFEASELKIPPIEVFDDTECYFRNIMAWEQCHFPRETHVCNYIDFMDYLIDTKEDVNLLVEAGIITNSVGDIARVAEMFNKLRRHIILSSSYYYDTAMDLKIFYKDPWNHAKATLIRVYFTNLWRGTGIISAVVLLLLTLIQTVFSILHC
ncbi:hypothetical protein OWV82_022017 [Melia azedarach]|uniref:Uncharacterized protein n=3 Tax=Melia azedarach TaxID=155640 RepID=A0ACC1X2R5_MELAZ|nr:hypothetical protein OWV82_022017 [Melia azedarach]KAJ4705208.1 hypothetical protein OWV82_022017 [Melia azedarach]